MSSHKPLKIAILGKAAVGKSSLTYCFLNKPSPEAHDATIEDKYKTFEKINGEDVEIEVLDTAGEEDYQNLLDMWISYADGFVLAFALNDKESFGIIEDRFNRIVNNKGKNCPIVLVANKSDLEKDRVITPNQVKNLATRLGIRFIESSAKENIHCKEPFMDVATRLYQTSKGSVRRENNSCCLVF